MPKISIIVPVYNVERYLRQCLDSLINQTFSDIEIICVNDGTPDESLRILEEYAKADRRIKIISQSNLGLSDARNAGLKLVLGEYIMFVDSDDWLELDTCEVALNEAKSENADVVFWGYMREFSDKSKPKTFFDDEKIVFDESIVKEKLYRRFFGIINEELKRPELIDAIVTAWGKLFKADLILDNKIEFVDTKIIGTEDLLFNIYAFNYVNRAVYLNKTYNHYRRNNETSLSKTYRKDLFNCWQKLFGKIGEYIDENSLGDEYKVALNNRICISIVGLGRNALQSKTSGKEQRKSISEILNSDMYRKAYKNLSL